jgi:hypothetical protein
MMCYIHFDRIGANNGDPSQNKTLRCQSIEPVFETVQHSTLADNTDSTVFIDLPINRGNSCLDAANSNGKKSKRQPSICDFFPHKK